MVPVGSAASVTTVSLMTTIAVEDVTWIIFCVTKEVSSVPGVI